MKSGTSQQGNNNAYCQDNEISWLDWEHADDQFLAFCTEFVAFRSRTRSSAGGASSKDAPSSAATYPTHRLVPAGRGGDDLGGLEHGIREVPRRLPQR